MATNKKFKVNVIELLLKNNKVAKYGELVSEDQLSSPSDQLKEKGFIATLTKSDLDKIAKEEKEAASGKSLSDKETADKETADKESSNANKDQK